MNCRRLKRRHDARTTRRARQLRWPCKKVEPAREALKRSLDDLAKVRKDAERYRWHKARNPSILLANAWGVSKAACEIGDDPDAATDAAMADLPAVGT